MPLRVQVRIYFKTNKVSNSVLLKKSGHFFLAACRFGADSLTFPGKFLDRSASLTLRYRSLSLAVVSFAFMKLKTATRAAGKTEQQL